MLNIIDEVSALELRICSDKAETFENCAFAYAVFKHLVSVGHADETWLQFLEESLNEVLTVARDYKAKLEKANNG